MAHPLTKELGGAPALGGSLFAAAHLLGDESLRQLGWAQVDFVFGVNPVGTHIGYKSEERVAKNGYWEGVENGWPDSHPNGYGKLGPCRGTLEGTPLDSQFPKTNINKDNKDDLDNIGNKCYATEGWAISNRGWMATLTFSTLDSQSLSVVNGNNELVQTAKVGDKIRVELKAALNIDWNKKDKGWVEVVIGNADPQKITVFETGENTGVFTAYYVIPAEARGKNLKMSYGYFGFDKVRNIKVLE